MTESKALLLFSTLLIMSVLTVSQTHVGITVAFLFKRKHWFTLEPSWDFLKFLQEHEVLK